MLRGVSGFVHKREESKSRKFQVSNFDYFDCPNPKTVSLPFSGNGKVSGGNKFHQVTKRIGNLKLLQQASLRSPI